MVLPETTARVVGGTVPDGVDLGDLAGLFARSLAIGLQVCGAMEGPPHGPTPALRAVAGPSPRQAIPTLT